MGHEHQQRSRVTILIVASGGQCTATNAARQYSLFPLLRLRDLYTYGGFYPIAGVGTDGNLAGWAGRRLRRQFDLRVGIGCPLLAINWWGGCLTTMWLAFSNLAWLADSTDSAAATCVKFHPVTATFVRSGSTVAMVPTHPQDSAKMSPNLAHVMPLTAAGNAQAAMGQLKFKRERSPCADFVLNTESNDGPVRSARTLSLGWPGWAASSTIAFDAKEHRFVNSNVNTVSPATTSSAPFLQRILRQRPPHQRWQQEERQPAPPLAPLL
jgi:hypothetical protein